MQVRLNDKGLFDVRDVAAYKADVSIPYEPSKSYSVCVDFDITTQRYNVKIDGKLLAKGYAFRASHKLIGQITAWHAVNMSSFELTEWQIDGTRVEPDAPCKEQVPDAGTDTSTQPPDTPLDGAIDVADVPDAHTASPDVSMEDTAVDVAGQDGAGSDAMRVADRGASDDGGSGSCACRIRGNGLSGSRGSNGSMGLHWVAVLSGFALGMLRSKKRRVS